MLHYDEDVILALCNAIGEIHHLSFSLTLTVMAHVLASKANVNSAADSIEVRGAL